MSFIVGLNYSRTRVLSNSFGPPSFGPLDAIKLLSQKESMNFDREREGPWLKVKKLALVSSNGRPSELIVSEVTHSPSVPKR